MSYDDMSDDEINNAVFEEYEVYAAHGSDVPDYCNNPSDAWPIIETIWDDLLFVPKDDLLTIWENIIVDYDSAKLRAAMIVFLKMKEQGNG